MIKVVGVRFKNNGKTYYFNPGEIDVKPHSELIVETTNGLEYGFAHTGVMEIDEKEIVSPLKPVIRIANEKDKQKLEEIRAKEVDARALCEELIEKHGLEMSLVETELTFDCTKVIFFFTADGRVDFRELVKDLASTLHIRIELRQIGVRDESKMLGGLGICGRPFCCSTFLDDFHSVTIKMAKDQGLSLAPGKISGTCGRLMCCLQYEQNSYEYLNQITPKKGTVVDTEKGRGTVIDVSILDGMLKVLLDETPDGLPIKVSRNDVVVLKKPKYNNEKKKKD